VIAYRVPAEDRTLAELHPRVTSSAGMIDANLLWDGDFTTGVSLPFGNNGQPAWIDLDFGRSQIIQSMTLALQGNTTFVPKHVSARLQASQDGVKYRTIVGVESSSDLQKTLTFESTTARYYRLELPTPPAP
jgi:hypothetical protein